MARTSCLTAPEVTAFHLGGLPEAELVESGAHVEGCPRCQEAIQALDGLTDETLNAYRASALADTVRGAIQGRPQRVGAYEILEEIGRGGMGVVYRARHTQLHRVVALKMVLGDIFADNEQRQRFRAEAEAVASLQHPHIVQLFEIGEYQWEAGPPCPYLCFEFVEGGNLAQRLAESLAGPRQAAAWLESLARAAHTAHQQGIIHRDLKPANVLLNAEGQPKICDFGVAKIISSSDCKTRSGVFVGTAEYMSPEQIEGKATAATDVYALGAILYEMLTGRPPFKGSSPLDTLNLVRQLEPVPPRRLQARLPRDLETICLKCLHKDAPRRYASAQALADDLRRFLANEPIQGRRAPLWEQAWKWTRRRPAVAGLLLALLVAVTLLGFVLAWNESRQSGDNAQAEKAAGREDYRLLALAYLDQGISLSERGQVGAGMLWMVRGLEVANRNSDQTAENLARANLAAWRRQIVSRRASLANPDGVAAVAFSPDGKLALTSNKDKTARLWDIASGMPTGPPLVHNYPVWAVAFSPDGQTILTGSGDDDPFYAEPSKRTVAIHAGGKRFRTDQQGARSRGEVRFWDTRTGKLLGAPLTCPGTVAAVHWGRAGRALLSVGAGHALLWKKTEAESMWSSAALEHPGGVLAACFDPLGQSVVTGGMDATARQWDAATGRPIGAPLSHPGPVNLTLFHPAGQLLLTGSLPMDRDQILGGEARLWQISTRKPFGPTVKHRGPLKGAAFSADGRIVATGRYAAPGEPRYDSPGEARIWDTATSQPVSPPLEHPEVVSAVALSPDGRLAATGCRDGNVRCWTAASGKHLAQAPNDHLFNNGTVAGLVFSADGRILLAGNLTSKAGAALLEVPTGLALPLPLRHAGQIVEAIFSPDGKLILTASTDHSARLWDAATGLPASEPMTHTAQVLRIAFSPDGQTFAASYAEKNVQIWHTASRKPLGQPLLHPARISRLVYSPDGNHLLTVGQEPFVSIWDVATGRLSKKVGVRGRMDDVVCSRNPAAVLTGDAFGTAQLWNTTTWEVLRTWQHTSAICGVALSPDGRHLATAGESRTAQIWRIDSDEPFGPPLFHARTVYHVVFSPDSRTLLTCSEDATARLWDVASGRPIGAPFAHHNKVVDVAFRPDNKMMLTSSLDGRAIRWELPQPLTGDVAMIRVWVEAITGLHMNEGGAVRELPTAAWQERQQRVGKMR